MKPENFKIAEKLHSDLKKYIAIQDRVQHHHTGRIDLLMITGAGEINIRVVDTENGPMQSGNFHGEPSESNDLSRFIYHTITPLIKVLLQQHCTEMIRHITTEMEEL